MIQRMKFCLLNALYRRGLDLRRVSSTPFGNRWYRDIQYFPNGRRLDQVLDVGANTGQTAITLAREFRSSRIYSFEPVPSTFQQLVRNTARHSQVEAVSCALGASAGVAKITAEPLSVSNRLVDSAVSGANPGAMVEVRVDTVESFCSERGITRVNLLKIDTEGYELDVLKGAEGLLKTERIDFILAECDFFRRAGEPHGDFAAIHEFLSRFRYHVVSFYTGGVDDLGWVWGDVLFRQVSGSQAGRVACSPGGQPGGNPTGT
jgi:FkbM family methyltransferase